MDNMPMHLDYNLNVAVVKCGIGSKILQIAKQQGIKGGTVCRGKGMSSNPILDFLELAQCKKEIVLMVANAEKSKCFFEKIIKDFKWHKPHTGIGFSVPLTDVFGITKEEQLQDKKVGEKEKVMAYNTVVVIVDRGNGAQVVTIASQHGATGATIIHARGSGIHETSKVFAFDIEPEKELVLMVVNEQQTSKVCEAIKKEMALEQPGTGIMFVQKVNEVYGMNH